MARPIGRLQLVALIIILLAAVYVVFSSRFIRSLGGPGVHDVSEVLEGKITEGSVSVRGIVDLVEPENKVLFLKDLKRQEVCIDSVCLFAVIKVHIGGSFEEGQEAVVTGLIAQEDGFPVIIAN